MAQQKLVNVKFDIDVWRKLDLISNTVSKTVTEVVRSAVEKEVEAIFQDEDFKRRAKEYIAQQQSLVGP